MKSLNPLVCFNGGELSPWMDSRTDLPTYRKGCRQLRNMIALKSGGAERRPGTQYVATGKIPNGAFPVAGLSRMQKFQFAPGTTFMLEFCDHGIRFYSGGAAPAQIQVSSAPAWVSGTNYPAGAFVSVGSTIYYLFDGPLINSTTSPGSDITHWVAQTAYEVPAPYSATNFTAPNYWGADVFGLVCCQINDVMYIVHPDYPVYKLTRYSNTNWVMQEVQFFTPAMLDQNATDQALTADGGTITTAAPAWVTSHYYNPSNSVLEGGQIYTCLMPHISGTFATDLANGLWSLVTTFQAGHIGSYWQLAFNNIQPFVELPITSISTSAILWLIGTWTFQTYGTWQANIAVQVSYDNGSVWQTLDVVTSQGDANYNISGTELVGALYRINIYDWVSTTSATPPRAVLTPDNPVTYQLIQITAVATALSASYVNISAPGTEAGGPTSFWSEGAWSAVRGYPACVTVFQERVWYANTTFEPQRIWGTQIDDIENFALVDQAQATYGLAFDLNAPGRGPIQWLCAQTDLAAGLAGAEWIITSGADSSAAIAPGAILAVEHSANGSSPSTQGLVIGNATFYVQRKGTQFEQMLFSVFTEKYMSQDMMVLSQHVTSPRVKQFDYQQQFQNQSLLWAVTGDGSLACLNYAMDQEVFAWSRMFTNAPSSVAGSPDFGFLSVQVMYGPDGQDDEVWVSTARAGQLSSGGGSCVIERLCPADWQTANLGQPQLNEAWYADCAITVTSPGSNVITGIPSFLGDYKLCASLNGNIAFSNLAVSGESVTLPNYVPAAGDVIVVGLPIPWAYQPMRFDLDLREGPIAGKTKSVAKLYVKTLNSIGGTWATPGQTATPLPNYPITQNSGNPPPFLPGVPIEHEIDVGPFLDWQRDPQVIIQGSDPLPFTLLSVVVNYDTGGKP